MHGNISTKSSLVIDRRTHGSTHQSCSLDEHRTVRIGPLRSVQIFKRYRSEKQPRESRLDFIRIQRPFLSVVFYRSLCGNGKNSRTATRCQSKAFRLNALRAGIRTLSVKDLDGPSKPVAQFQFGTTKLFSRDLTIFLFK